MNEAQKKIMIAVAIGLVVTFLFPPHAFFLPNGGAIKMGYEFIAKIPDRHSIHMLMLFAEWLGIVVIGGISYFIAQDTQLEYTPQTQSNRSKGSTSAQPSTPDAMNKYKRWLIRIIGFLFVLLIYSLWREVDKETGGLFPGSALLRGALVFISLSWIVKISNAKSIDKELKSETYPEKTNNSAKVWLLVIGTVILAIWLAPDQENKNTLPVSAVQTQPAQAQQATLLNANSAQDMFNRANDLYNQGQYAEAFPTFRQLAEQGQPNAQNNLGWMYFNGQIVTQDNKRAVYWYRKAAEQEYATAQNNLGWMYDNGKGVAKNGSHAAYWYKKAAEQGEVIAQNNLGQLYYKGEGVAQSYEQAFQWYKKSAKQGYIKAQYNLGQMYYEGQGVTKDYDQALAWYHKAADQGFADAQNSLGWMYQNAQGVTKDYDKAVTWYRKAAEQGQEYAQTNLGWMYDNGLGVLQDYNQAFTWYRKAAEQGYANAQNNLGNMYKNGQGVPKDYKKAVAWCRKAVEQGVASAQNNLGDMYENGQGVPKDYKKAVAWYRKSAEQGEAIGQYSLGTMYHKGRGVTQDNNQAAAWYRKAAEQGEENAITALKDLNL
jgi:TPR repeat protein